MFKMRNMKQPDATTKQVEFPSHATVSGVESKDSIANLPYPSGFNSIRGLNKLNHKNCHITIKKWKPFRTKIYRNHLWNRNLSSSQ